MVSAINGLGNAWGQIKKTVEIVTAPVTSVVTTPPPPPPTEPASSPTSAPAAETPMAPAPAAPLTYAAVPSGRPQLNAPPTPQSTLAQQLTKVGFYYSGPDSAGMADPVAPAQQVDGDTLSRAQIVAQAAYSLVASAKEDDRMTLIQQG